MRVPVKIIDRGSSDLKVHYLLRLEAGLIISLSAFLILSNLSIQAPEREGYIPVATQEIIEMEEIIQTKQEARVPPPPRPVVPIAVPNDEIIMDDIIEFDSELNLGEVYEIPPPPPSMPADTEKDIEEEIFVVVEQYPELIGGLAAFQSSIKYPELALKAGIEGRVIIQFIVDTEGNVADPVVLRGIGGGCDEEALRAIKAAKFKPGKQRGIPVNVRFSMPVTFMLRNSDKN